jgi:hypothetical protein
MFSSYGFPHATKCMEVSPFWETPSYAACQEFRNILWKPDESSPFHPITFLKTHFRRFCYGNEKDFSESGRKLRNRKCGPRCVASMSMASSCGQRMRRDAKELAAVPLPLAKGLRRVPNVHRSEEGIMEAGKMRWGLQFKHLLDLNVGSSTCHEFLGLHRRLLHFQTC